MQFQLFFFKTEPDQLLSLNSVKRQKNKKPSESLFEFAEVTFVGCGHLASALCIDKDITRKICKSEKIRMPRWLTVYEYEWESETVKTGILKAIQNEFAGKAYIKAARLGSSIGVYPVKNETAILTKAKEAFKYDSKIIIEEMLIKPREITVGAMGLKREIVLSEIGEFNYGGEEEYFSYNAKYRTGSRDGIVPADIPDNIKTELADTSRKLFRIFDLEGFARLDFFLCGNTLYFNEINTIPGMDKNGTFMRMWERSGVSYNSFIDKAVDYAFKRYKTSQTPV